MTSTSISLPFLRVDSFVQAGDVDDTACMRRAASAIQVAGGGTLWFSSREYLVRRATAGDVCDFVNCHGVTLLGFGATIRLPNRAFLGSEGTVFHFTACTNVYVDGFKGDGPHLDTTLSSNPYPGYEFIRADQGCSGIRLGTNYIKGYIIALNLVRTSADPQNYRCRNIDLGMLHVVNCGYGVGGQFSGDHMRGTLRCDDTHRACIIYAVDDVKLDIWDKDHKDWSVLIGTHHDEPTKGRDWHIRYHKDTDSQNCSRSSVVWRAWGHSAAQTARNVRIELDVNFAGSGSTGGAAFMFTKQKDDGSSDDTARGHVFDNFVISGSITGQGSETGPGVTVGSGTLATDVNCAHWEGEVFHNLAFRSLRIAAMDANGAPLLILGGATDQIVLDGVSCNRDFAIYNDGTTSELPRSAKLVLNGVECLNRFANGSDFRPPPPALDSPRSRHPSRSEAAGSTARR